MSAIADWWWNRTKANLPDGRAATRLTSLDSVRGLAALSVVVCHYVIFLQDTAFGRVAWHLLSFPPLCLFRTAYGSVILFFVLSGYVLALSLLGEKSPSWSVFAIRRFFRIWPAYAITIIIASVIGHVVPVPQPVTALFAHLGLERVPESVSASFRQLVMTTSTISLDIPGWSLVHELRISLAFPLLLVCVRRAPTITLLSSLCLQLADRYGPPWLAALMPDTTIYVVYFCMGAWLAVYRTRISALLPVTPIASGLICLAALFPLSIRNDGTCSGIVAGAGATLIIASITTSPGLASALSARWCEFLGRVSYSLYLTHVVILGTLLRILGDFLPPWLIFTLAIPIIGLVAVAGYYWVERPSIRLGRAAATRIAGMQRKSGAGSKQSWASAVAPNGGNERCAPVPQDMALLDPNFAVNSSWCKDSHS